MYKFFDWIVGGVDLQIIILAQDLAKILDSFKNSLTDFTSESIVPHGGGEGSLSTNIA